MLEGSQNTQGQNAPDKGTKIEIDKYAAMIDEGNPDKVKTFLQNTYSDKELESVLTSDSSVVMKSLKKAYNADSSRAKKQSELDVMMNLAKRSDTHIPEPAKKSDTGSGDAGLSDEDSKRISELVDIIESAKDTKEALTAVKAELATIREETSSVRSEMSHQSVAMKEKRVQEGFEWLKGTLGEKDALALYDPDNPTETAIGQLLHPELIDETTPNGKKLKVYASKRSDVCFDYDNPVLGAIRLLGMGDVMGKVFNKQAPESEGSGRAVLGEASDKDKIKQDFFGDVLGIE